MYNDYYSFSKKPFNITPNPDFLFLSENHKEVFAHLLYGIRNHSGFIEVTGEVGTGKTTVLRTLLNQLDNEDYRLAFVFNPALSALELLQTINREFGIVSTSQSRHELQTALNQFLLAENRAGRTVVLVIDEAQNLQAEVLEEIRLLSNLETETDKLVQIILVGQPELAATLSRPELRQLSQRITVRYHLKPMSFTDSTEYIAHRLRVAGHSGMGLFESRAVREIYRFSRGYPRLINVLCDRALLVGYSRERSSINAGLVKQAIRELERDPQQAPRTSAPGRLLTISLVIVLLAAGGWYLHRQMDIRIPPEADLAAEPAVATPAVNWDELDAVRSEIAGMPWRKTLQVGGEAMLASWANSGFDPPEFDNTAQIGRATRALGLDLLNYTGEFSALLDLNLPTLLELTLPGETEPRYLAILGVDDGLARISPVLRGGGQLPLELLKGMWTGRALVVWKNHAELGYLHLPGVAGRDVMILQDLLLRAGYQPGDPDGIYDQQTLESVTRFQADRGLAQDGRVGPQTLIHLYQAAGSYPQPGLAEGPPAGGRS